MSEINNHHFLNLIPYSLVPLKYIENPYSVFIPERDVEAGKIKLSHR